MSSSSWLPATPDMVALVAILGLCLGSFLNVVIYRLPRGLSLVRPRSRCGHCGRTIRARHNIPVLSWLLLRGRCADCRQSIPFRYPLVELLGCGLTLLSAYGFERPIESVAALWLSLSLLAVFFIDLEHWMIPDEISLGGTVLGLALAHWTVGLPAALIGAAVGALSLFLTGWIYQKVRGRAGMGMGDVKLAAMLGAFLGWKGLLLTVLLASFLGSVLGIVLVAKKRGQGSTALPFGCFLAPAALTAELWGGRLWAWYLAFFP